MVSTRAASINEESRTVDAVIATETPVLEGDFQRDEYIPRVLLASGAVFKDQFPLLDCHSRWSTESHIGSCRGTRVEGREVVTTLHFSKASQDEWTKVMEGHVRDVSAGFSVQSQDYLGPGETRDYGGASFTGPMNVATHWTLLEASITPIGADENATLRSAAKHTTNKGAKAMDKALRAFLETKGLATDATDADAVAFSATLGTRAAEQPAEKKEDTRAIPDVASAIDTALTAREAKQAARQQEVRSLAEIGGVEVRQEWYAMPDAELRAAIVKAKSDASQGVPFNTVRMSDSQPGQRLQRDIETEMTSRALVSAGCSVASQQQAGIPANYDRNNGRFSRASYLDLARDCARADGYDDVTMNTRQNIALAALGLPTEGIRSGAAVHVTASFPNLMGNVMNKVLSAASSEYPATWRGPCRQGETFSDFRERKTVTLSAAGNLPIWPDNTEPEEVRLTDSGIGYAVDARSETLSFSYQSLVNDQFGALPRLIQRLGSAAARTVDYVAWSQLLTSQLMPDGQSLFSAVTGNRFSANLITGSAAPTATTLSAMRKLLRRMKGINGNVNGTQVAGANVLGLQAKYLIHPSELEQTVAVLLGSTTDVGQSNPGVMNNFKTIIPVCVPFLDDNSATAFYLMADWAFEDTIEVSFLEGQESPVLSQYVDVKTKSLCMNVLYSFGAKAMGHRGMIKHAGV